MTLVSRVAIAAALVLAVAGAAAAQTSGVLNTLDVQRLVAADTPAAHLALSKHFMAVSAKYAADAARFRALAAVPTGNPNHPAAMTGDLRRTRQADAAMAVSEGAHAMVSYHQLLAIGATPHTPVNRAAFDGGRGARTPSAPEIAAAVASAHTLADHRALEEYFATIAAQRLADAETHAAMARGFRAGVQRGASDVAATHCERLAARAREDARHATDSARLQHQLANVG